MKVIQPIAIDDSDLVSSSIVEQLPAGSSAVTYNLWDAGTAYSVGNTVCWVYTPFSFGTGSPVFAVFDAIAPSTNYEPGKTFWTGSGTLPGSAFWRQRFSVPAWAAGKTYSAGTTVGRIAATTGATFQSLQSANLNHDPNSSPTWWRQATDDSYASWSGATTYALGERVAVFAGTVGQVFESLQAGNLNHAPESSPTWWSYVGSTYKTWASGTAYGAGDIVISLATHHAYECQSAATGKDPTDTANRPTYWVDLGATNRWAMFDQVTSSKSEAYGSISFSVALPSLCDTLALMDMTAASVHVQIASGGATVYDQTFDLSNNGLITDWRRWFFDPITYKADLILNDLPLAVGAIATVTISYPGAVASIGTAAFGLANELGLTAFGATPSILDFSIKKTDDFGVTTLVPRPFAKRCSFQVTVAAGQVDAVQKFLAGIRATPAIWQGDGDYAALWIYGFYKDFSLTIAYPTISNLSLEIEGLT